METFFCMVIEMCVGKNGGKRTWNGRLTMETFFSMATEMCAEKNGGKRTWNGRSNMEVFFVWPLRCVWGKMVAKEREMDV